ncbi:hypothetical protein M011DRAFT_474610 [Sporormia fimetaria CBS 119925]|uniref:Uncharacterized protein n=1 Tax=Sporormia fimetaria CBS 119925 TaxID=1340428 RepID=A0A6A6VLW3_9PLEO|nr:hypothetical protein M011DRAFT_474610 [Sporormia fimetaria CBS 119925]
MTRTTRTTRTTTTPITPSPPPSTLHPTQPSPTTLLLHYLSHCTTSPTALPLPLHYPPTPHPRPPLLLHSLRITNARSQHLPVSPESIPPCSKCSSVIGTRNKRIRAKAKTHTTERCGYSQYIKYEPLPEWVMQRLDRKGRREWEVAMAVADLEGLGRLVMRAYPAPMREEADGEEGEGKEKEGDLDLGGL